MRGVGKGKNREPMVFRTTTNRGHAQFGAKQSVVYMVVNLEKNLRIPWDFSFMYTYVKFEFHM